MTFEEWLRTKCQPAYKPTNGHENRIMRAAFTAARRMAMDECARIALQYSQACGQIDDAMAIARDIRATIKEDT